MILILVLLMVQVQVAVLNGALPPPLRVPGPPLSLQVAPHVKILSLDTIAHPNHRLLEPLFLSLRGSLEVVY